MKVTDIEQKLVSTEKNLNISLNNETVSIPSQLPSKYLYISSGACFSGIGNTTFSNLTSSNSIYRVNADTGARDITLFNYSWPLDESENPGSDPQTMENQSNRAFQGDSPVGISELDKDRIFALIENTTDPSKRRIEILNKKANSTRTDFYSIPSVLNSQLRKIVNQNFQSENFLLVSKTNAIEQFSSLGVRNKQGANPFIQNPGGSCGNLQNLFSDMTLLKNGNIVFLHAGQNSESNGSILENRIGIISASGYGGPLDCLYEKSAPHSQSSPSAVVYDSQSEILFVAYSGNNTGLDTNSIYAYSVNEATNTISNPQKIYDASLFPSKYSFLLYGISTMAIDLENKTLYVATAVDTSSTPIVNYNVEKFSYDLSKIGKDNNHVLFRVPGMPFVSYGVNTKCISSMFVGN